MSQHNQKGGHLYGVTEETTLKELDKMLYDSLFKKESAQLKYDAIRSKTDNKMSKKQRQDDLKQHQATIAFEEVRYKMLFDWKESKTDLIDKIPVESAYRHHWLQTILADNMQSQANQSKKED